MGELNLAAREKSRDDDSIYKRGPSIPAAIPGPIRLGLLFIIPRIRTSRAMNNPMHKGSEGDDEDEQIVDWLKAGTSFADAYSGFATVAALIFGFSSSLIWQLGDESSASAGMKVILICMTIALSGIALVVHTIHYYVIQELRHPRVRGAQQRGHDSSLAQGYATRS